METESTSDIKKITEKHMTELIGCTKRALEHRRQDGRIPEGVWMKHGGRIIHSKKRYDEWLESHWIYPEGSKPSEAPPRAFHMGWYPSM